MKYYFLIVTLLLTVFGFAQKGKIEGKITDATSGSKISAVSIFIVETNTTIIADIDGRYHASLDSNKTYSFRFSAVGYKTKLVEDILVISNQIINVDVVLDQLRKTEIAVEVKSSARKESTNALIAVQKNTSVIAQVISAETIKRSPDKNTGEILKRIPGTSVQEGKYLVVRGLSDRYNQAMLNGILLSSTEPDRKTFSFDIFPAAMVDNIIMNKTFIPELPGEWAGGLVQVQTKDVPTSTFFNMQLGTGFNSNTIGSTFLQSSGGKMDWLGVDDGTRALPSNLPLRYNFSQLISADKTAYGKEFRNNWKPMSVNAPLNSSIQVSAGGTTKIFRKKISGIFALTYNNTNKKTPFNNIFIANNNGDVELMYENNKYSKDILAGGLANVTIQLNNNNKISFKNLINVNSSNFVVDRFDGRDYIISGGGNGDRVKATEIGFKQNTFFNTQVKW